MNWRAELRANDVDRRPPPKEATPDRGHVEQPGERSETRLLAPKPSPILPDSDLRRRVVVAPMPAAPTALVRAVPPLPVIDTQGQEGLTEEQEQAAQKLVKLERDAQLAAAGKKRTRTTPESVTHYTKEQKHQALERCLTALRKSPNAYGILPPLYRELGIAGGTVSGWLHLWRKEHGDKLPSEVFPEQKTLLSKPTPPASAIVPKAAPQSGLYIPGLEDAVRAIIEQQCGPIIDRLVGEALRRKLAKLGSDE